MKISRFSPSNFRYHLRRYGYPSLSSIIYPPKYLSFSSYSHRYDGFTGQSFNLYLYSHIGFRFYSVLSGSSSNYRPGSSSKEVLKIVDILNGDQLAVESKLNALDGRLSVPLVAQVFRVLNSKRMPGLCYFYWIRYRHPDLGSNPEIYSLVIDNCGRLDDYNAMRGLLSDFRMRGLSLTGKAFEYLPGRGDSEAELKELTQKVMIMLKEIGGICWITGVHALIEMFGGLGYFSMAKFVIGKAERRLSNYNVLFKEMCRRCEFGGAWNLMDEMRSEGYPLVQNYNRLISTLLKNRKIGVAYKMLEEMKWKECPPDALTYEVFICHYCNYNDLEVAFEFFSEMMARDLRPRLSTHAQFIRGYFNSKKYEEAHKYVVELDDEYSRSVNYSLLARLFLKAGNAFKAENILSELIEKGLRPNHKVYTDVRKRLLKAGMEKLATDLEMKLCQLEHRP
ncbi:hypothetical protein M5689_016127 [Euphorbia peplus]|nr:hypothetical protein M5689_016127 [Euphorbia peplus]